MYSLIWKGSMSKSKKNKYEGNNEFYLLMEDAPVYNRSKSFYDQSKDVIDFFTEEITKLKDGITIDGVYIHPWLYWHLNYFKTPIPIPNKRGETDEVLMTPPLDDHIWYFLENYKRCQKEQKAMLIFGCRGFSKTTTITSNTTFLNTMKQNGTLEIIGGDEGDLNAIGRLMDISFNSVHPAFLLPRNKSDWDKHVEFGLKTKTQSRIVHSDIFIKNAVKGTGKASEKGAGGSPIGFTIDEIGKWDWISIYQSALPAFKTQYGWKAYPILSGTGGNNELSKDAKKALKNPAAYDMLEMDWDILNNMCPKEFRTWEDKKFGVFVPGQMSYRLPVPKIETNLADFLGKKSKYLSKIKMFVTDWEACHKYIHAERKRLESDEDALNKFKMYHPLNIDECFLETNLNPFPVEVARKHLIQLEEDGNTGTSVELFRSSKEWSTQEFSGKKRAEFPFPGGECDAPMVRYGNHDFPTEKPPQNLYVGGLDGYKVDISVYTDSVGVCYVLKRRNTDINTPCERIAVSYASRPYRMNEFHQGCETVLDTYNAQCCMESIDQGFIQYLDTKQKAHDLLTPAISFGQVNSKKKSKVNTKFGIYPTKANQEYMFNLFVSYCKEQHEVDMNDDGTTVTKMGVEFIDDVELLKEVIAYKKGGNFDRIIAFSHSLAWCRYLDKEGYMPDFGNSKNRNMDDKLNRQNSKRPSAYGKRRANPY